MPFEITDTTSTSSMNGVKCLVYGPAGVGKTMLCATAPAPIILSNESGLLSLSKANIEKVYGANQPGIAYNIPVIQITTMAQLAEVYDWLARAPDAKQFQTVCLDSLSEYGESLLALLLNQVKDPRQAYGDLLARATSLVRLFRDLPNRNVYFSGKMEPVKDEALGLTKYGVSMPGSKLGPKIPYFFDEVFALRIGVDQKGQQYRYLQTQLDNQYEAKDRSGALAPAEYPHLGAIFAKITSRS